MIVFISVSIVHYMYMQHCTYLSKKYKVFIEYIALFKVLTDVLSNVIVVAKHT